MFYTSQKANSLVNQIIFLLIFVFASTTFSYSQEDLTFEERILNNYKDSIPDVYDLLHTVNYDSKLHLEGKKKISSFIQELNNKGVQKKSLKKQIQTIYKKTHSNFFSKYDENAFFNDIFKNGNYNCVTASALYALIFDEFKINYSIRETPNHVYIIADTLGLQTLIESTLPGSGVMSFNAKYKKDYIEYLKDNKIISESEFQSETTEKLFKKYYTKDKSINKYELAAIQYYNKGIFLFNEEKYSGAAKNLAKALTIYPSNTIKYMHYAALQNALINDVKTKTFDGEIFGQIVKAAEEDESLQGLSKDYFNDVSHQLCIESPDIERYNTFFDNVTKVCPKEKIPSSILSKYHFYLAYNNGISSNYKKALEDVILAYNYDNDNLSINELAINLGTKHLFVESNYTDQIDNMEYYFEHLPFLTKNKMYQSQYTYYHMKVISEAFKYDNHKVGQKYYDKFVSDLTKYDLIHFSDDHISYGFSSAAYYYASKNNFKKAASVVSQGLDLAPSSYMLTDMKRELNKRKQYVLNMQNYKKSSSSTDTYVDPAEKLKQDLYKHFPGKWQAETIIIEDMEQALTPRESFELDAHTSKRCTYSQNDKIEEGKWAYRKVSRCIYFVPKNNKDGYKVFKLKEVTADKLVLIPFKDQKKPSPYKYVLKRIE